MSNVSECRACHKRILWVLTAAGKRMPVDDGPPATVVTKAGVVVQGQVPHWSTCTDPTRFRAPKAAPKGP